MEALNPLMESLMEEKYFYSSLDNNLKLFWFWVNLLEVTGKWEFSLLALLYILLFVLEGDKGILAFSIYFLRMSWKF